MFMKSLGVVYRYLTRGLLPRSLALAVLLSLVYFHLIFPMKTARTFNLRLFDIFYKLSLDMRPQEAPLEDVVIVSIDDESMRDLNVRWPWPRGMIAGAIKNLAEKKPAAMSVDLVFIGESEDKEQDLILAKVLGESDNIYIASYFGADGRYVVPEKLIANSATGFGFVNKPRDADNSVRRMRPYVLARNGKIIDHSIGVKVASQYTGQSIDGLVENMPILKDNTVYINYFADNKKIKTIPVWKVLRGKIEKAEIENKIVFVGVTSEVFHDIYQSPVGIVPGVFIGANEALTYITGQFMVHDDRKMDLCAVLVFGLFAILVSMRLPAFPGLVAIVLEAAVFSAISTWLMARNVIIEYFGVFFVIISVFVIIYSIRYVRLTLENMWLRKEAVTDGLTRLYAYRYFEVSLKRELKRARSSGGYLGLAIYDLDHFKNINDTYGHEFGNKILKDVSRIMLYNSKGADTVARYGGEEFCVIMLGIKPDDAKNAVERIRHKIQEARFQTNNGDEVGITISAGIATIEDIDTDQYMDFVRAADTALYKSKDNGRNRSTMYRDIKEG
ncbi:MAG: diguanylate cyclase [Candidatus Omnitrophica bacterium]|nr:diguanylate cyclase [Candidatus Omnitrophota bacterium]MDD5488436.1 diguanylate cyclase [Candidatus Omnitrophota bacterium]